MKKLLSLLLAVMMVITMLPTVAIADELELFAADEQPVAEEPAEAPAEEPAEEMSEPEQPNVISEVAAFSAGAASIYSTVSDIVFLSANGEEVEATTTVDGDYTVYTIQNANGTYTYSANGYGTGTLKLSGNDKVYLRDVNYTLKTAGDCTFKVKVVNTEDSTLVYESSEDSLSVKLLIPALEYNVRYKAHFVPTDEDYADFEVNLWVTKGTTSFDGFKRSSYNLSDSCTYKMGKKTKVTFNIPHGATLKVQQLVKFYRQLNEYKATFIEEKDGYDVYEAYVSDDNGGVLQYEVTKDGYIKKGACFKATAGTITVDSLKTSEQFVAGDYNNSIITNGNYAKFIELDIGEAKDLWFSRAWQAIDTITTNMYMDPDNHFYILEGDSVKIDEYGVVTGVKKGVSVIAMTYDAMEYNSESYDAIDPDKIAVFVISVGGNSDGVETGISIADLHTFYYVSSIKTTEGEVRKNGSYSYTFTPTATNGENIEVSLATVYGYPTPTISEWKSVSKNSDGSFTAELTKGRNIIRVKAGDAEDYYVLHANETEVTIENATVPGAKIQVNDVAKVSYTNIILGIPKLGAIYNPGYPDTTYLYGKVSFEGSNIDDVIVEGEHNQYKVINSVEFEVISDGKIKISDLRIHSGSFGEAPNAHLVLGLQSTGGIYTGGDSKEMTEYYSYIQDIEFETNEHEHLFDREVADDKYFVSEATEWHPAKYYKSCRCGEKGTEIFADTRMLLVTGSEPPTDSAKTHKLETIKLIGVYGRLLPGSTETDYVIEVLPDTDKTKSIDIEMKALIVGDKYNSMYQISRFLVNTGTHKIATRKGISSLNNISGTVPVTLEWDENDETSFQAMWTFAGINTTNKNITKYNITLKIHKHTFDREVVDEKYLASDATCTEPAKYYISCECGEHGTETFEHGEALGHNLSGLIYNRENHWKKCTRCGEIFDCEEHNFTEWSSIYGEKDKEMCRCLTCGYEQIASVMKINGSTETVHSDKEENPNTGAEVLSIAPAVLVLKAAMLPVKSRK